MMMMMMMKTNVSEKPVGQNIGGKWNASPSCGLCKNVHKHYCVV